MKTCYIKFLLLAAKNNSYRMQDIYMVVTSWQNLRHPSYKYSEITFYFTLERVCDILGK